MMRQQCDATNLRLLRCVLIHNTVLFGPPQEVDAVVRRLHSAQQNKEDKVEAAMSFKQYQELKQCTFAPDINKEVPRQEVSGRNLQTLCIPCCMSQSPTCKLASNILPRNMLLITSHKHVMHIHHQINHMSDEGDVTSIAGPCQRTPTNPTLQIAAPVTTTAAAYRVLY